jgi:hypothetical protein
MLKFFLFLFLSQSVKGYCFVTGNVVIDVYVILNSTNQTSFSEQDVGRFFEFPIPFLNLIGTYLNCLPQVKLSTVSYIVSEETIIPEATFGAFTEQKWRSQNINIPAFLLDNGVTSQMDMERHYCAHHYMTISSKKPYMVLSPYACDVKMLPLFMDHEVAEVIVDPWLQSQHLEIGDPCTHKFCKDSNGVSYTSLYLTNQGCACQARKSFTNQCTGEINAIGCSNSESSSNGDFFSRIREKFQRFQFASEKGKKNNSKIHDKKTKNNDKKGKKSKTRNNKKKSSKKTKPLKDKKLKIGFDNIK